MIELPLVFVAGVLGSGHCIGMCGPFTLVIGASAQPLANLLRQAVYTVGRIMTYAMLGAVVGFGGSRLADSIPGVVNVPAILAIAAGLFLLYQGLVAAGWLHAVPIAAGVPCFAGGFLATFLTRPGLRNVLLAGLLTGFLPCGLVYAFLALAGSSASLIGGASIMAVFGLGTAPVMILTGCGGSLLGLAFRQRLYRLAACCLILTGVVSLARGVGFLCIPGWFESAGCPLCW
jgi:hypothetical protein